MPYCTYMNDHLLYFQNANIEILCFLKFAEEKSKSIYQETNLINIFQFHPFVALLVYNCFMVMLASAPKTCVRLIGKLEN